MKQISSILLSALLLGSPSAFADVFPESFEEGSLDEKGWVTYSAGIAGCGWQVCSYAYQTTQFPINLQAPPEWGEMTLHGLTKGAGFVSEAEAPDILAASPEFTVNDAAWLSFLLSCNMVNNGGANVADDAKTVFEVVVSPEGSEAKEAFTDILYSDLMINLNKWKAVNVDLSKYKGKKIRVGFRMSAKEAALKNAMSNFLYIDGVQLLSAPQKDVALKGIGGLFNGTVTEQYPVLTLANHGPEISELELLISVNDGDPVKESAEVAIPNGETVEYTLKSPVTLQPGQNTVSITVNLDGDCYPATNSASGTATILGVAELPFEMAEGAAAGDQMVSTASGSIRVPDGWQFLSSQLRWVHTKYKKEAWLYPADSYYLDGTPLKVSFDATMTGNDVTLAVYLTRNLSDFGEPVATLPISKANSKGFVIVPVAEEGNQIIGFRIFGGEEKDQVLLNDLKITKATTLPDVGVTEILMNRSVVAGTDSPVSVRLVNEGSETASDIRVYYTVGDLTVEENAGDLESGEYKTYTFETPLRLEEGEVELIAGATASGDIFSENETSSVKVVAYNPYTLPYKESFEKEEDTRIWNFTNTGNNSEEWRVLDGYEFDGTHILSLAEETKDHSNYAVSPAIAIEAGWKGRLSYYYGAGGNVGTSVLRSYLTRADRPEEIIEEIPLASHRTNETNVVYASVPVSVEEAGNYRIVFYASEGAESLLIDDVRLDATPEIAAVGAEVSVKDVAYDLEPGEISVTGTNYGLEPIKGVKAGYMVMLSTPEGSRQVAYFEEDYNDEVAPGEEFTHTFSKKVDFDEEGIYSVAVAIATSSDTDPKNNTFLADGPEKLTTMRFPAKWDMEFSYDLHGFNLGTWKLGAVDPYAGSKSITHTGNAKSAGGDLVTFNRVYLEKGLYDFSFFWKTSQFQTGANYNQSFKVLLGEGPDRESLNIELFSFEKVVSNLKPHSKALTSFNIEKSGYYWIGINLIEGGSMGQLTIDDFEIKKREEKVRLTVEGEEYVAGPEEIVSDWQFYHPNGMLAQQWLLGEDNQLHLYETDDAETGTYVGSWLQAPAFLMEEDMRYEISADLEILPIYPEKPLSGKEVMKVYASEVDLPSEFKEIGTLTGPESVLNYESEDYGLRYLTIRPESFENNVEYRLKGFRVKAAENTYVSEVCANGVVLDGDILTVPDGTTATLYSVSGLNLGEVSGSVRLAKGIFLVQIDGQASKIVVK